MRLFSCFFFVFSSFVVSHSTSALAFSDDCGCAGDAKPLALDKSASNVSAIILSDFGYPTSQRVLLAPLSAAQAMRGNLFEEITAHSIATASSDRKTPTKEEIKKMLAKTGERYITNHKTKALMCIQALSSNSDKNKNFAKTLKFKQISLEKVFLNLKCPIRPNDYALCQNPDIPDDEKRDALERPLCGDIFFLASFYSTSANSLYTIMDSLIEHDSEKRFLPKILQCKRLTRTFYNEKTDRMETRCLPLVDIAENNLSYTIAKYPNSRTSIEAFAKIKSAFERDYFKLMPDESPPTKEFCQKYATLSCHEDLPDSNAW